MAEIGRSLNQKKMTTNLMSALFKKQVLATSSVTGNGKEQHPALNKIKVQLIIGKLDFEYLNAFELCFTQCYANTLVMLQCISLSPIL